MVPEFNDKLARVRSLLLEHDAPAAILGRQAGFSWLSGGGEAHVPLNSERALSRLVVTRRECFVLANRIEMGRLLAEELKGLPIRPLLHEWLDTDAPLRLLSEIGDPRGMLSDTGDWGTRAVPEAMAALRYPLHPAEVRRLRELGRAAEAAVYLTCHAVQPGLSETVIAGHLAEECWQAGLTPVVMLIASDERLRRFRHPLPTGRKLKRTLMVVLCARHKGLIVSLTRLVHFGRVPADLQRRHRAVCAVDVAFNWNTRVGTPIREVYKRGVAAYAAQGYPGEWKLHHQGGPGGYETRESLGSSTAPGVVLENQSFTWNPSITGTKSEDTVLATVKGPQVITESRDWPMVEVDWHGHIIRRPDILVR